MRLTHELLAEYRPEHKTLLSENPARLWASLIADQLVKQGVHAFYLCPGMRNAPLVAALLSIPQARLYVGADERATAYRALGHAKLSAAPVAILCTSGTALANMHPAAIEASKSDVPLIVISADRPPETVMGDANQTMPQLGLLTPFWRQELGLPTPSFDIRPGALARMLAAPLARASWPHPGPVHLNIPFREPLDLTPSPVPSDYLAQAQKLFDAPEAATCSAWRSCCSNPKTP